MSSPSPHDGVVSIGRQALQITRRTLLRDLGDDGPERLEQIGSAAGEELYGTFRRWLPDFAGIDDPADLDAARLGDVLTAFFSSLGWGAVRIERLGRAGFALASGDWAEADPSAGEDAPSCFVSAGLFADFLTRLAEGTVSIMEIECRSRGDEQCRFLAAAPQTLEAAYDAMAEGRDYRPVFGR